MLKPYDAAIILHRQNRKEDLRQKLMIRTSTGLKGLAEDDSSLVNS